jgi:hypothetical protein
MQRKMPHAHVVLFFNESNNSKLGSHCNHFNSPLVRVCHRCEPDPDVGGSDDDHRNDLYDHRNRRDDVRAAAIVGSRGDPGGLKRNIQKRKLYYTPYCISRLQVDCRFGTYHRTHHNGPDLGGLFRIFDNVQ